MQFLETRSDVKFKVIVTQLWYATLPHLKVHPHTKFEIPTLNNINNKRYAPDTIILKTRSEVKVKVTVTQKWYATLWHPKMHPHIIFGIHTSKNIGDMHRTRSGTDRRMHIVITIKTKAEVKVNVTVTQNGMRHSAILRCIQKPNLEFLLQRI